MNCKKQLEKFLTSPDHNTHLRDYNLQVYVRKGHHCIDGKMVTLLDIASVEARVTGAGLFTRFLDDALELNTLEGIYIQNILTERFTEYFRKRKWHEIKQMDISSFYLMKEEYGKS